MAGAWREKKRGNGNYSLFESRKEVALFFEIKGLKKSFGVKNVVSDLSLSCEKGEIVCILGQSGCGKSTTLSMIGGFIRPDAGRVYVDGDDITDLAPEERPVVTVFQSYGLFPHMNVRENISYGLKFRNMKSVEKRKKTEEYMELVGLIDRAEAKISELSGGQQQRVALARALIVEPKICLLDEPLCNLDATLRVQMRQELKKLQHDIGITMLFVTHDQEEALVMSDKMAIMHEGRIIRFGTPKSVCDDPGDEFVKKFLNLDHYFVSEDGKITKVIDTQNIFFTR